MLVSQPALPCAAVGVLKGPDEDGLVHSADVDAAGPVDQQHVLDRFVDAHFYKHNRPHCVHSVDFCVIFFINTMVKQQDPVAILSLQ